VASVVRESVTVAGRAERARVARAFVGGVLGPGHPCGDAAVLLVSELFGNSVRHSGSGAPGETVTVAVRMGDGVVRVEVTGRSGPGAPELEPAGRDAEGGRGASACCGPRGAVGVAAARRADGDLVRAAARLTSPPGDVPALTNNAIVDEQIASR
jgi:anti-sigma regulatory factor (Ser/Thr protein kinase)